MKPASLTGRDPDTFDANLREAHIKSGAPGTIIQFNADKNDRFRGTYVVRLQYGHFVFKWRWLPGGHVRVKCHWKIGDDLQRRQATSGGTT